MADWSKMRKQWADKRDSSGVKKGAVSGVSLGDAIDKVMKGESKGYTSLADAAKALDAALTKYKAKIAAAHPDLVKWIDKTIGDELDKLSADVKVDVATLQWVSESVAHETMYGAANLVPDYTRIKNVTAMMTATPPKTWAQATAGGGMYTITLKAAPEVSKRAVKLKGLKWSHPLAGHSDDYQALTAHADLMLEDVKFFLGWTKAADLGEFADFMKEHRSRNSAVSRGAMLSSAIKSLLS